MSTPHSLPSSNSQRITTQLPFSPTPSGAAHAALTHRLQSQNRTHSGSTTNAATPHTRTGSLVSSRSRQQNPLVSGELFSPPLSLPPFQPRPSNSASYAAGIQPSSSFFHPSRPSQGSPTPPFIRSASPGSMVSSEAHAMMPVHLAPFTRQDTQDTEHSESGGLSSTEDLYHGQLPSNSKFNKHSREPLLPIAISGARRSTASRPSIAVTGPYGKSETNVSTTGRMRGSFEKLFKRGLSFETGRKPVNPSDVLDSASMDPAVNCISRSRQTSPISPTANGRMTFDLAATDEEHSPVSPITRYKNSSTHPAASLTSLQDLVFNPIPPYDMNPPLAETPIVDTKTGKHLRNWQLHPSRNRFFGGGHFLTGGDSPWAFIASLTLVLGITGVWFGTTCLWWWFNESPAVAAVVAYMCLLTISSMLATAFRDPGILPRNLDPDPPSASTGSEDSHRVPLPRDLKVRAGGVRVKYCPTCRTYRPPRSSHCKMCDNCIDGCDHHCQWVNNCVGRRNYTSFFTFLFSAVLTLILVICTTAIHLWLLTTSKSNLSFRQALGTSQGIGSAIGFSISIVVFWPVTALLAYHARLLLLNITTIEQIRMQAHKTLVPGPTPPNPFSHGNWRRNLLYVLCRPPGYSWLDFPALATEDKREINPGLVHGNWPGDATLTMEEGRGAKQLGKQ